MGIPHLITFLQPYARLESLAGRDVVIDGPAFAYHIYYLCLASRSKARSPFEAIPSYAEIGDTAISWLNGVRRSNATIKKIYFDGFLPPSKLDVRLGRLVALTRRLTNYYHAHPTCHIPISKGKVASPVLYGNTAVRSGLTALPPVPFLVPAVLEALRQSDHYNGVTEVVPGEADSYCSRYLTQFGGIVFTGDSDLLVHELGDEGAVSFFNNIQVSVNQPGVLQTEIYHPITIAKRLLLPTSHGLLSLGFEMFMDHHGTFPKLLAQAKTLEAIQKHMTIFEDFRKEYIALKGDLPTKIQPLSATSVLRSFDPRISEFVLQFPFLAGIAGEVSGTPPASTTPHIFPPFLLDCAVRTNAWEMSTPIRQLAYGLINIIVPETQRTPTVLEHKKQYDKSKGRELQLPAISEISKACMAVVAILTELRGRFQQLSPPDLWIAVAVYQDIEWSHSNAKPVMSTRVKQWFRTDDEQSWDVIQLVAQIESSYYSFRILKQLLALIVRSLPEDSISEPIILLHRQLDDLPQLSQLKSINQASSIVRFVKDSNISGIVYAILGIVVDKIPTATEENSKAAKKKRKRSKASAKSLSNQNGKSNNFFDVLGME